MADDEDNIKICKLQAHEELRVVINHSSESLSIELIDGVAEIFGIEMIQNKIRKFSSSFAVCTWRGCTLKLNGSEFTLTTSAKKSSLYNLHLRLEESRIAAEKKRVIGPVTLICGPQDVGKSTLTRCLLNFAARCGRQPLFVDLDVGQSSISIPGTLGILQVDCPGDIVKGYNDQKQSVYFFGHKSPGINILLYFLLIDKMGQTFSNRMRDSSNTFNSGAIIDTCGWVTGHGYKSILHAANSFCISKLIVVEDQDLHLKLKRYMSPSVEILFIDKLDGVVERSRNVRADRRDRLVHEYFYGSETPLKPYLLKVNFSDIEVLRINSPPFRVTDNMFKESQKYISVSKVALGPELLNRILGLSYTGTADEEVVTTSVLGFVCVKDIDMKNQVIQIISPQPAPLPNKIFIISDITYHT